MDFEPVKTFHGWRNMIIFSEITDDLTAHVLYMLEFIQLVPSSSCQENYSNPYMTVPGPRVWVVQFGIQTWSYFGDITNFVDMWTIFQQTVSDVPYIFLHDPQV